MASEKKSKIRRTTVREGCRGEAVGVSADGAREGPGAEAEACAGRVLVVAPTRLERDRARARLGAAGMSVAVVGRVSAAADRVASGEVDLVVTHASLPDGSGMDLARAIAETKSSVGVVLVTGEATVASAVEAMQSGALDLIDEGEEASSYVRRVGAAMSRARRVASREARIGQLRALCRQLNEARDEVTRHVGSLCDDLVGAYQELSDKMVEAGVAAELNAALRAELDIEDLLRTALEFALAKIGPMNAGVFLPGSSGDYALGAYVNYDCPKGTSESLLDHLADAVPPLVEGRDALTLLRDDASREAFFGASSGWMDGKAVVAFACEHEGESLAVCVFFRDESQAFDRESLAMFDTLRLLFTSQLARVIHLHHRHLPREAWGDEGHPFGESGDGDDEFGPDWRGGMAA